MAEDGQPPIQLNLASKGTVGVGGSDPPRHRGNLGGPPETLDESRFSPLANGQQATAALAQQAAAAGPSTSQQAVAGSSEEGGGGRKEGGKGKGKGPDDTWERFTFEELLDRNVGAEMALEVNAMSNEEQIEWWEMWKKVTQRFQMEVTPQPDDQTLLDEEEARTARLERAAAQAAQIEAVLERQQREKRAERERVAETGREHTRSGIGHASDAAQRQATAFLAGIGPGATATPQIAAPTPKGKTLPHICYTDDGEVDAETYREVMIPSEYAVLHNDRRYIPLHLFTDTAIAIFEANKNALLPKSLSNVTGEEMRFIDTSNALFGNELSMNALDIHDALPRWEAWAAEIQPSGLPRLSPAQIARWIREWRVMGKGRDFQKEREYLTACHEVFIIRKKQWLRLPFRLDEAQLKEEVEKIHRGIERRAMDSMRAEMVNLKRAYDLRDYGRQNSQGGPARSVTLISNTAAKTPYAQPTTALGESFRNAGPCLLCGKPAHIAVKCTQTLTIAKEPLVAIFSGRATNFKAVKPGAPAFCYWFNAKDGCREPKAHGSTVVHKCSICAGSHAAFLCSAGGARN